MQQGEAVSVFSSSVKWVARTTGVLLMLFCLFMGIGYSLSDGFSLEGFILGSIIGGLFVTLIISWKDPRRGGLLTILLSCVLGVFAFASAGHNKVFAMLVTFSPFATVGWMFFFSWWVEGDEPA